MKQVQGEKEAANSSRFDPLFGAQKPQCRLPGSHKLPAFIAEWRCRCYTGYVTVYTARQKRIIKHIVSAYLHVSTLNVSTAQTDNVLLLTKLFTENYGKQPPQQGLFVYLPARRYLAGAWLRIWFISPCPRSSYLILPLTGDRRQRVLRGAQLPRPATWQGRRALAWGTLPFVQQHRSYRGQVF